MTFITYSPIDRQFRTLERDLPPGAPFNGIDPLDGIEFGFALESRHPLSQGVPDVRYGTVEGDVEDDPAIGLRVITEAEYEAAWAAEEYARKGVPEAVTPAQAQVALYNAGILDAVEALIAAYPYPVVKVWFRAASEWRRDHPYIQGLGMDMGLTDDQMDDLFIAAGKITV